MDFEDQNREGIESSDNERGAMDRNRGGQGREGEPHLDVGQAREESRPRTASNFMLHKTRVDAARIKIKKDRYRLSDHDRYLIDHRSVVGSKEDVK